MKLKKKLKKKKKGWLRMEGKWLGAGEWELRWEGGLPLGAVISDCIVYLALCEREGYVRF